MKLPHRRRLARAALVALALGLALEAVVGALLWDHFLVGIGFALLRWPALALAGVLALVVTRPTSARTRRLVLGCAVVVALLHGGDLITGSLARARTIAPEGGRPITVLAYNLLFRGGVPEDTLEVIARSDADVLALQEITPAWHRRLEDRLKARYPHRRVYAHVGTHGYAVYSRFPLSEPEYLWSQRKTLPFAQVLEVRAPGRTVALANAHLLSPAVSFHRSRDELLPSLAHNLEARRKEWRKLTAYLDERYPDRPHLVVGDLNTMEPDPLHREVEQRYVDAFRATSLTPGFTWPALGRLPLPLFRIDYVLASPELYVDDARVMDGGGSDHRAVLARLRI